MANVASADVVVIGAGLFGTSVAFKLAQGGASVVIIDKRGVCSGDSKPCFGMLRRHYSNEVTARLAQRGIEILKHWDREVGVGDSGYVATGYLLTVPEEHVEALRANVAALTAWGIETHVVEPPEIAGLEPLLRLDGVAAGAYEPDGGFADPHKVTLSWLAAAAQLGASIRIETVTRLRADRGRIRAVETGAGPISTGVVVNAAGAWARQLAGSAGVDLPIALRRIQVAELRQPADRPQLRRTVSDMVNDLVVRPDRAGSALAVVYDQEQYVADRDDCAEGVDAHYEQAVRSVLAERLPSYAEAEWIGGAAGTYDYVSDWNPIIGEARDVEGLFLALGSGHGFKLAPAVGEVVADLIAGRRPAIDVSELGPDRFGRESRLRLAYGPSPRA